MWRTAFRLCLAFGFLLMVIITSILLAVKLEICHHRKYPPEQCPSKWIGFKNKCYFISEEEKTWTSSQTFCAENESMHATFETQEEMHSLAKHLKIDNCWIGLHKKGETFYWENGAALKKPCSRYRITLSVSTWMVSLFLH